MIKKLQTFWNNNFTTIKQILTIVVCSFIAALVYPLLMIGQQIDKGTELYVLSPGMWGFFNLITETFYTKILHYTKEKINSLNYAIFTTTGFVILNIPILIFIFFKTNKNFFIYTCFIIFLNTI